MRTLHFSAISAAFLFFLQSSIVVCSPLPVNSNALIEGKDWTKSFSLKPLSEERDFSPQEQQPVNLANAGTSRSMLHLGHPEILNKEVWGSELSLGGAHKHNIQSKIRADHTHPGIRDQWLQDLSLHSTYDTAKKHDYMSQKLPVEQIRPIAMAAYPAQVQNLDTQGKDMSFEQYVDTTLRIPNSHGNMNAQAMETSSSSKRKRVSSSSDSMSSEEPAPQRKYIFSAERRKAISESVKEWRAQTKRKKNPVNHGQQTPEALISKDEAKNKKSWSRETKVDTKEVARAVLEDLMKDYDSQSEKKTISTTRGAINGRIKAHNVPHVQYGIIWQSMRGEFGRNYPGRRMPNFLQSKKSRRDQNGSYYESSSEDDAPIVTSKMKAKGVQVGSSEKEKRPLMPEELWWMKKPKEVTFTSKEVSRNEARRLQIAAHKKLAKKMLIDLKPRLKASPNTISQGELHEAIGVHMPHTSSIGRVKMFMRDKWIKKNPGKAPPLALLPREQVRDLERIARDAEIAKNLQGLEVASVKQSGANKG